MKRKPSGKFMTIGRGEGSFKTFIPDPLPPASRLEISSTLRDVMDDALVSLGRLDSVTTLLPEPLLFLYTYVRREAVLSSQIEGTQSSLSDLLLFELKEAPGAPIEDVKEVSNYVTALEHGMARLRSGFPLCCRLFREIHAKLLSAGRGSDKQPGEFRRSQNWIQGARPSDALFVPPPPENVEDCMGSLEKFLHDIPGRTPALIKAAWAHVQFETIHPFLDGNGRIGRLLITLLFCKEGILRDPMLYLSLYFKKNRKRYFDLLMKVRTEGDWEAWLEFFACGVKEMASEAVQLVRKLDETAGEDRERIARLGSRIGSALRVHRELRERPLATISFLVKKTGLTTPTVTKALETLGKAGLVREVSGRKRNRFFSYDRYLKLLSQNT